jgi:hypothetical protein
MRSALFILAAILIATAAHAQNLSKILGVTHVDGKYFLTHDEDFLNEGADQVLAVGTKVIKVYLTPERYPWNSDWPKDIHSLVEMAQTPYFKRLFAKPFDTFVITAYTFGRKHHYFTAGVDAQSLAEDTRQFHDLAKYLLATYRGSGKTFVLQHWEGDWALRDIDGHTYDIEFTPTHTAIDAMIQWLNARQAGITQARAEIPDTDVHVYGAAEANRVVDSMNGRPGVANSVLPHTNVDLVSYSSWDSQSDEAQLAKAVDFLGSHLPETAVFGQSPRSVYIGEFGGPENGVGGKSVDQRISNTLSVTKSQHLPWAIYWEIYCNEPRDPQVPAPYNGMNDALKGHWMIKPDGTAGTSWHRFRQILITSEPARATASAIKAQSAQTGTNALHVGEFAEARLDASHQSIELLGASHAIDHAPSRPCTLGVRLDSADGHFVTLSYYIDDAYAGSWFVVSSARTIDEPSQLHWKIYAKR